MELLASLTEKLRDRQALTPEDVRNAVAILADADAAAPAKESFLEALRLKGESAQEIAAFAEALLDRARSPQLDRAQLSGPLMDLCGTGGDKLDLFNISTTTMFVLAAGGVCVAKHGNRAMTSRCGGADVLESLGVPLDLPPSQVQPLLEAHGLAFLFAPNFHPAFAVIGPVRRALAARGVPTVFNILGPLLNPARPDFQMTGVFDPAVLERYAEVMRVLGRKRAWVYHGGADELTSVAPSTVWQVSDGALHTFQLEPTTLGYEPCAFADLRGESCEGNSQILSGILDGSVTGAMRDTVILNAAAGFVVAGLAADFAEGRARAEEALNSGKALGKLQALVQWTWCRETA